MSNEINAYVWPKAAGKVVEVTETQARDMFEVLPPMGGWGFFGVSEPHDHCGPDGRARYHWFKRIGKRHFCTLGTRAQAIETFDNYEIDVDQKIAEINANTQ